MLQAYWHIDSITLHRKYRCYTIKGGADLSRNRAVKAQKRNMKTPIENTIDFVPAAKQRSRSINLTPRTRNQERLVFDLMDPDQYIVISTGPAGTGKTYLAMLAAIKALQEQTCDRIVLTRPAIGVEGESHGFLPGSIVDKMEPWTRPLLDVLREHYRNQDIVDMIDAGIIEISPLAYMRGRTFKNAWIIADEMQNATPAQVKMLMTRIGVNSRVVITGDVEQADRDRGSNGLIDICARMQHGAQGIAVHEMTNRDIQRHPIIDVILDLYEQ